MVLLVCPQIIITMYYLRRLLHGITIELHQIWHSRYSPEELIAQTQRTPVKALIFGLIDDFNAILLIVFFGILGMICFTVYSISTYMHEHPGSPCGPKIEWYNYSDSI